MSIYLFEEGYFKSDFGRGAAISILMLADRRGAERRLRAQDGADRRRRSERPAPQRPSRAADRLEHRRYRRLRRDGLPGLLDDLDGVQVERRRSSASTPTWFPLHPTLQHFRDAINKPFFWEDVKNSLIVVTRHRRDLDRARVPRRDRARALPLRRPQALRRARDRHPDAAAGRPDHPALRRARALPPGERADRR